jgi:GMP synthase-like glutamine amidotransferase
VEVAGGKPEFLEIPQEGSFLFSPEDPGFCLWMALARERLWELDGLLLGGGRDVHPHWYGEENRFARLEDDPRRDPWEVALFRVARERGLPVLGICRGVQVINVAAGGTLIQDLDRHSSPTKARKPVTHCREDSPASVYHPIRLSPSSFLFCLYGKEEITVNSRHHQAVGRVAPSLRPVAWAEDGTIEALEADSSQLKGSFPGFRGSLLPPGARSVISRRDGPSSPGRRAPGEARPPRLRKPR